MTKTIYNEIDYLCRDCGKKLLSLPINKNKRQFEVSTWYPGRCDYCGEEKIVTEARDFGYPDLPKKDLNGDLQFSPSVKPEVKEAISQILEAVDKAVAQTRKERPELFKNLD